MHLSDLGDRQKNLITYKRKLSNAIEVAKEAFMQHENVCINISAGKDSIAMLAVVSEAAKELNRTFKAWIHVSDASFPGTIETAVTACELCDVELLVSESKESAFTNFFNSEVKKFGKKGVFFDAIKENIESNNFDLVFIGNRISESSRRRRACLSNGNIYSTTVPTNHTCCTPIMRFEVEDVAATIQKYGLPWHPVYSKWHDRGFDKIRLGYMTATDLSEYGTVIFLKINYPDIYNRLSAINSKIRAYV